MRVKAPRLSDERRTVLTIVLCLGKLKSVHPQLDTVLLDSEPQVSFQREFANPTLRFRHIQRRQKVKTNSSAGKKKKSMTLHKDDDKNQKLNVCNSLSQSEGSKDTSFDLKDNLSQDAHHEL